MKRKIYLCIVLFLSLILLVSCSDGEGDKANTESNNITNTSPEQNDNTNQDHTNNDQFQGEAVLIDLSKKETSDPKAVQVYGKQFVITAPGIYRIYGTLSDCSIIVDAKKDSAVNIVLENVNLSCSDHAPIYIKKAESVTITLSDGSQNVLSNLGEYTSIDENNVDAVIFSKTDIIVNGNGYLSIKSEHGNGITSKDNLFVKSGNIDVNVSGHALEANDSITVDGGTLKLTAGKDAIHSENDEDTSLGVFTMNGGTITVNAEDDAIHALASLTVNDGTLNIEKSFEGFEAAKIYIKGGNILMNASDDGINATIGAEIDCYNGEAIIDISGGKTEIITKGDALDSNGDILMTGGEVLIHGPGNEIFGYGTLDYVNKAEIHGGRFIAFTSSGKGFLETSTQASFNLNLSEMISSADFELKDSSGKILVSETAKLPINCVIVSIPELTVGSTYTANVGGAETTVKQRSIAVKIRATVASAGDTNTDITASEATMTKCTYDGLNYWLYTPANAKPDMPLIVYLHGGSGKGDDLELITNVDGFPKYIKEGTLSADAYIVFPQCPSDQNGWKRLSTKIEQLINHTCHEFSLNTQKISLTGHSMGGTGTWTLALSKPDLFYKIAPMSGSVTVSDANIEKLSKLSVWAFVGGNDKIVSPETSIAMIEALKNTGADAQITVFAGATHFDVPSLGYLDKTINIIKWLID